MQQKKDLPAYCLPNVHHQRNLFYFGSIEFNSDFDSGNMLKVERNHELLGLNFNIWIMPDAYLTQKEMKYKTWFHFSVQGVSKNTIINMTLKDINFQQKLYKDGHQPVFKSSVNNQWQRLDQNIANTIVQTENGMDITFTYTFQDTDELVYFAFTYPWSYTDNQEMLDEIENTYQFDKEIYFHRSVLVYSKEYRNVELITITSSNSKSQDQLKLQSKISFPQQKYPLFFPNKRYIFISTRVHPGEVPGSHVFNGMLKMLLDKQDIRSKNLRENFVFVMIPLINPDGVSRGHYRTDSQGCNLNRFYINPGLDQPEIYSIKELLMHLYDKGQLYCYMDLHAQASKKGSFIYGNCMDYKSQIECNLLTKLMALNTPYFEYELCNFTEKNMYSKDKSDGLSKEGAGRVALYKQTRNSLCYTLECNYNMPFNLNTMYSRSSNYDFKEGKFEIDQNIFNMISQSNGIEQKLCDYPYISSHYANLGEGMLEAILDLNKINPISRIPNSPYKNYTTLKMQIAFQTMKQLPYRSVKDYSDVSSKSEDEDEQFKLIYNQLFKNNQY
ncbi:zinc carboxypeptidase family protein, putative [Ichthyophthirius multifiliis]|uniref:Cytosolic carboxypeptidase-like protein 5 n=1 Tax=Ichthyophthirius multifiliis TaxID=5932 RepID=G0R6E8_ICHMU|nr:zinc carboxypeptidase family protein, putative [Ichthyophthirius multifiliis]EGR26958.1 zinc carboxypeptidase family protein, putative [Ichthyophthirius multifiliis]|eukprot:XP_004023842.1 zinc carboxypeptidase family protein, putative [Ichthyophthirius multifiliis]